MSPSDHQPGFFLTQSGIIAFSVDCPLEVVGTLIIFSRIINSSPDAKSLSVIAPSDHQPALFLTQSGIEISFEGGGVLVVGFRPPGPTSINPEPIPAYVVS